MLNGSQTITMTLAPLQPFRLDLTARALVRRSNNRIDAWDGVTYQRVVPANEFAPDDDPRGSLLLTVKSADVAESEPFDERLELTVTGCYPHAELAVRGERAVRKLLGLDVDLQPFYRLAAADPHLADLVERLAGLKPPRYPGLFQALLNAVPCQQVTLTLGLKLLAGLAELVGPDLSFAPKSSARGPLALPGPAALAQADPAALAALGMSRAKARALHEIAAKAVSGELELKALAVADNDSVMRELQRLYGVGRWTAEYVLLRGLGRLDMFPDGDSGARNSLARFLDEPGKPSYQWVAEQVERWQPYAGLVYLHLLVDGFERKNPPSSESS